MHSCSLLLLAFTIMMCRSEAFASTHATGRTTAYAHTVRGGSSSPETIVFASSSSSQSEHQKSSNINGANGANGSSNAAVKNVAVEYVAETKLPTDIGQFQLRAYRIPGAPVVHEPCVIYSRDKPPFGIGSESANSVPVRIHDQCLTSEVFRSQRYVLLRVSLFFVLIWFM
jgi:hypothetical protein